MNNPSATQSYKGQVLNRIYRVWLFRKLLPVVILEVIILAVVLFYLGRLVFVERILGNAFTILFAQPSGIVSFIVSTFSNATFSVKILGIGLLILLALLIRHLTQGLLRLILVRENYFSRVK